MRITTLCYVERGGRYLMLHRVVKENDANRNKWIGIGGKLENGESPDECVRREAREETGCELIAPRFRGLVTFVSNEWGTEYMCLYTAAGLEGEAGTCDEGVLEWVDKDRIDALNLWEGDKIFFRLLNENAPFFSLKLRYEGQKLVEWSLDGGEKHLLKEPGANG